MIAIVVAPDAVANAVGAHLCRGLTVRSMDCAGHTYFICALAVCAGLGDLWDRIEITVFDTERQAYAWATDDMAIREERQHLKAIEQAMQIRTAKRLRAEE